MSGSCVAVTNFLILWNPNLFCSTGFCSPYHHLRTWGEPVVLALALGRLRQEDLEIQDS
jgi:hypothetical protein